MPKSASGAWILLLVVVGLIVVALYHRPLREGLVVMHGPSPADSEETSYKPGFLPSRQQRYWFEGMPPSLRVENNYWKHMMNDCGGDVSNYECRQKSYLKAMKDGTTDKTDLICWSKRHDEDQYYACLDAVYGNYQYMDRNTGVGSCVCPSPEYPGANTAGVWRADGTCFCQAARPLNQRSPLDPNNGETVTRVL